MKHQIARVRRGLAHRAHDRRLAAVEPGPWSNQAGVFRAGTAVIGLATHRAQRAGVVLLLPTASRDALFAGVRTAIEAAVLLAERTDKPLRILTFDGGPDRGDTTAVATLVTAELGARRPPMEIDSVWTSEGGVHPDDLWVATYWTTAHALDVAARSGIVDPARVVSLVQDHEPSFFAASAESAAAASTYRAGFRLLVNTRPLQRFLAVQEGIDVPDSSVFGPALDTERLEAAAARRTASTIARIGFYGRPSKPRNAYNTGVAALRVAATELTRRGIGYTMTSMGESHRPEDMPDGRRLQSAGRLSWAQYFDQLAVTDVLLSLQMTPHPSHPPLDAVTSGALAVTNDMIGTRSGLHQRLIAVPTDPESLGNAIADAAVLAIESGPAAASPGFVASLGRPLATVVETMAAEVDR